MRKALLVSALIVAILAFGAAVAFNGLALEDPYSPEVPYYITC